MMREATTLQVKQLVQRELAIYFFVFALLLFVSASTYMLWQYLLPGPTAVAVKHFDLPATWDEPYHLMNANPRADLFIAEINGEWFALDARTPHTTLCKVRWISANQRFEDPCSGSKFAINGGYLEGPAWGHLARYAMQVERDALSVDLSRPLVETKSAFIDRCFQAQRQRSVQLNVDTQTQRHLCRHGVCSDLREYVPDFAITDFCGDLWQNHQGLRPYFHIVNP